MRKDKTSSAFLVRWKRAWRPLREDPADYGTAFGLDLSMEEGIPHAVTHASDDLAVAGKPPSSWLSRWWRGRMSA